MTNAAVGSLRGVGPIGSRKVYSAVIGALFLPMRKA